MSDDLNAVMARLPDPDPPSTLMTTVMTRIAREPERTVEAARPPARPVRDMTIWVRMLTGGAFVVSAIAPAWFSAGSPGSLLLRAGMGSGVAPQTVGPASLLLAAGLLLYLTGLFAPVRR
jgi:hypothetical protein